MPETLSIVLPALDEVEGIVLAVDAARSTLDALVGRGVLASYEILVVDDGSTDGTGPAVAEVAATDPAVRLLTHATNQGVGGALQTGIAAATGDLLLYSDADMPVDLAVVEAALPLLAGPEVGLVAGRRRAFEGEPLVRVAGSRGYDLLVRLCLGLRETDVNFPFKLLRTTTARALDLQSRGALVDVEMLARTHQLGLDVAQITLEYQPRTLGSSKTMSVRLLRTLATELVRLGGTMRTRARSAR